MSFCEEIIGDCRLILGDCREVLPTLGKVDAVVDKSHAVVFNQGHEKPAKRQHCSPSRSNEDLGAAPGGNPFDVCQWPEVSGTNGRTVRRESTGLSESVVTAEHCHEIKGQTWCSQWPVQGRKSEHGLSPDGGEIALQSLRLDGSIGGSPSGRSAHKQHARESGSDVLAVSYEPSQTGVVEPPEGWAVLTDPPYETLPEMYWQELHGVIP